jgi:hypothetical protein
VKGRQNASPETATSTALEDRTPTIPEMSPPGNLFMDCGRRNSRAMRSGWLSPGRWTRQMSGEAALQRIDATAMLKARDLAQDHRSRFRQRIEIDVHVGQRHSGLLRNLEIQSLAVLA